MHVPWLGRFLGIAPVAIEDWTFLLGIAAILLLAMELEKLFRRNGNVGGLDASWT
jgi:hypothetical protein